MIDRRLVVPCALLAFALAGGTARGDVVTSAASDNATVQPGGPRPGDNGKIFFNVEGSANGTFASFGVIDFSFPVLVVGSLNTISLQLTQANAAFTHNGGLSFFLAENNTANIQPGSSVAYDPTQPPSGLAAQLGNLRPLGTGTFTQGTLGTDGSGTVDTFTFTFASLTGATQTLLLQELQTGQTVRVVVGATDPTTAATYAGFSNDEFAGPQLQLGGTFTAIPEPASLTLLVGGGLGLAGMARRRRQGSSGNPASSRIRPYPTNSARPFQPEGSCRFLTPADCLPC
jgi:hypothetical protein